VEDLRVAADDLDCREVARDEDQIDARRVGAGSALGELQCPWGLVLGVLGEVDAAQVEADRQLELELAARRQRCAQREGELHAQLVAHVDAGLVAAGRARTVGAAVDGGVELDGVQPVDAHREHEVGVLQGHARGERGALEQLAGLGLELDREGGRGAPLWHSAHAVQL